MLQQTQVKTVIPYWQRWMRRLPGVRALARARPDTVLKLWEGLGYYSRVRNLQATARMIVEKHAGRFPDKHDEVLALPGIGRYTAGAICSIAYNQPTPVLDGNVIRVLTRLFGIAENPREKAIAAKLWSLAESLVREAAKQGVPPDRSRTAEQNCSHLNQALMELGAVICTARRPKCTSCPLQQECVALRENRVDQLPNPGKRIGSTRRRFAAFVVERKRRFLVCRRPPGGVNARLWEFPNLEVGRRRSDVRRLAEKLLGSRPLAIRPLHTIRHTITRYRITLDVFRVELEDGLPETIDQGSWRSHAELNKLAFPSAHRRILRMLRVNQTGDAKRP